MTDRPKPTPDYVLKASRTAYGNRSVVEKSLRCGCYYCAEQFDASEITRWASCHSALCPKCGIDSVIPDASGLPIDIDSLVEMGDVWFGGAGHKPISVRWLESIGGVFRPNNGWMFGPVMVWKYGAGWGVVIGSMEPHETITIKTREQVLALLFALSIEHK